jgi:pimeloyl-ACP methyl ester carboxylesterase
MSAPITRFAAGLAIGLLLSAAAQEIVGAWHGTLSTPAGDLRLVLKVTPAPAGGFAGEVFSLDQKPGGSAMTDLRMEGSSLSYAVPDFGGARYEGQWDAARQAWVGQYIQGPVRLPLTLEKGDLAPAPAIRGLDGDWQGLLQPAPGVKLRMVLHVATGAGGTSARLDVPDQQANGLVVAKLVRDGDGVRFALPAMGVEWSGTLAADGKSLAGTWTQRGHAFLLDFARAAAKVVNRPQTPKPPFPYRAEEVSVDSAPGVRLAGTLTLPAGNGPFPGVVLITGSGAEDRDETIYDHKPFLVLADHLSRHGIAVLRLDDRGFAKSTGDFAKATTADFAIDAEAAARYLRARPEINAAAVGFIGHSEGGLIAPIVAARDPKIAFAVLMAGPGAPMIDVMAAQRLALAPGMGKDVQTAARQNAGVREAVAAMRRAKTPAEAQARAAPIMTRTFPELSPGAIQAQTVLLSSDWMRELLAYDPRPALRRMRIPVLALIGSRDRQVPADQNIPVLHAALKGDRQATVMELPGLNHLFQTAPTGAVGEYADLEETIAPSVLDIIADWIVRHAPRGSRS